MADKLEPLSDPMKELLSLCNIDPNAFQQKVLQRIQGKTYSSRNSTQKGNKAYYDAIGRTATIAEVAERVQAQRPARVYIPLGYVMYIRKAKCLHCGVTSECMDCPSLYLMQTDKRGGSMRLYQPVASVVHTTLPHYISEVSVETLFCPVCYSTEPVPVTEQPTLAPSTPVANVEQPRAE